MFDKILNFFKGSKTAPKIDFTTKDLGLGFILEYDLQTWVVDKEFIYDWGSGYTSKEWLINSGSDKQLLFFDDSEETEISISKEINILGELAHIRREITENDVPRTTFSFDGKIWNLTDECPCLYSETGKNNQVEMVLWVFKDSKEEEFISFSRYGSQSINGYRGKYLKEFEISNILPSARS